MCLWIHLPPTTYYLLPTTYWTVQSSSTSELIFKPDDIIAWITRFVTIKPGDLILTGTAHAAASHPYRTPTPTLTQS